MKRINILFAILPAMLVMSGLVFAQDTTLTVAASGNVGIGTGNPANKLSVEGDSFFRTNIHTHVNASNSPGVLQIGFSRGTESAPSAVLSDNSIGFLEFAGFNGTSYEISAWIRAVARENFTSSASGTDLDFMTHALGSNTNFTRMTIKDNGNVGIGTTNPSSQLEVAGTVHATSGGFRFPDGTTQTTAGGVNTTVLNVPACQSLSSFNTTYGKILDVGNFVKLNSSSTIEVTFNGRIAVTGGVTGSGAIFELRVNDTPTINGRARASFKSSEVGSNGVPVSITGIFTGLSSGSHTVSIWVQTSQGTGTDAFIDPGCWSSDHVVVKEF